MDYDFKLNQWETSMRLSHMFRGELCFADESKACNPLCSTGSKLFQLSKLPPNPDFSQANCCCLGTVVWILSDNA